MKNNVSNIRKSTDVRRYFTNVRAYPAIAGANGARPARAWNKNGNDGIGGGVVKVTANGKLEISSIEIDKDVIDPNEKEMLEDLIIAAVNRSIERARELADSSMNEVARSMLPPGFPIS